MKKLVGLVVVGCLVAATLPLARAKSEGARPEGVSAEAWIALGTDAGFVITSVSPQSGGQAVWHCQAGGVGSVPACETGEPNANLNGVLVARHNGRWVRLNPETTARIVQAR
jgi:hypothetical protein